MGNIVVTLLLCYIMVMSTWNKTQYKKNYFVFMIIFLLLSLFFCYQEKLL